MEQLKEGRQTAFPDRIGNCITPLNTRIKELNRSQQRIMSYVHVRVFHESFGAGNNIFTRKIFLDIKKFKIQGKNPTAVILKDNQHITQYNYNKTKHIYVLSYGVAKCATSVTWTTEMLIDVCYITFKRFPQNFSAFF